MHFCTELQDLPVVSLADGKELGRVKDLLVDYRSGIVQGLILEYGKIFQKARWIKLADIQSIGRDAVTVSGSDVINGEMPEEMDSSNFLDRLENNVISVRGTDLGIAKDLVFAYPEGQVVGIEISGGLWTDLDQGRKTVLWENIVTPRENGFVVDQPEENLWS